MPKADDLIPDEPRGVNMPRLDRKIEAARRRAEAEKRARSPMMNAPERFEKDDHRDDGTVATGKP